MNKLRSKIEGSISVIARSLTRTRVTPNELTTLSLLVAALGYLLVIIYKSSAVLFATILVSGFIDVVDGALARATGRTTRRGAFLDSFFDRLCETFYALSLIELGFNPKIVLVYLALAMLVSYARARGESLGVSLSGVGLMERAERLIALLLVSLIMGYNFSVSLYLFIALTCLTALTVAQRFMHVWRNL